MKRNGKSRKAEQGEEKAALGKQPVRSALPLALAFSKDEKVGAARDVALRLHEAGHEAYFVGGFVRGLALLTAFGPDHTGALGGKTPDIDLATSASPEDIDRLFQGSHFVGQAFGVSLVDCKGHRFEVATFRKEGPYSDKRRPDYVKKGSLFEDSCRRDFTINALYWDPLTEETLDFHSGLPDLKHKTLRTVGNPKDRFSEDSLRVLRMARFAATMDFEIEKATLLAAKDEGPHLASLARERVLLEMGKISSETLVRFLTHLRELRLDEMLWGLSFDSPFIFESTDEMPPLPTLFSPGCTYPLTVVLIASWKTLSSLEGRERKAFLERLVSWPSTSPDRKLAINIMSLFQLASQFSSCEKLSPDDRKVVIIAFSISLLSRWGALRGADLQSLIFPFRAEESSGNGKSSVLESLGSFLKASSAYNQQPLDALLRDADNRLLCLQRDENGSLPAPSVLLRLIEEQGESLALMGAFHALGRLAAMSHLGPDAKRSMALLSDMAAETNRLISAGQSFLSLKRGGL